MPNKMSGVPIEILLVEDNPADIRLTREGFKEGRIANTIHSVTDGQQALDFLYRRGDFSDAIIPDLILLDLNLPGVDGRTVLETIKNDQKLKPIPVVVITSSEAENDILKSYNAHANCYISKPLSLDQFLKVTSMVEDFWFSLVKLPTVRSAD